VSSVFDIERAASMTWSPDERASIAGWSMASNGGFTRRANSATPTTTASTDPDVRAALANWLAERGSPLVIRITPPTSEAFETELIARWGIVPADETVVMTRMIGDTAPGYSTLVDAAQPEFAARLLSLNDRPVEAIAPWTRMVSRLGDDATGVHDRDRAVGFVAVAGGCAGVYSVAVGKAHRRQGRATDIMATAEAWAAARGAHTAFLQVHGQNAPALALYERLGYEERYRYHYLQPRSGSA
jgi:ribosomal protein S18 acetylase RimI-like enzyme